MTDKYFKVKPGLETANISIYNDTIASNAIIYLSNNNYVVIDNAAGLSVDAVYIGNTLVVDSSGYWAGPKTLTWFDYTTGYSSIPTLTSNSAEGMVYTYLYNADSVSLYRFIASNNLLDGFYLNFDGSSTSNLLVQKTITI
jgi:hypothetical protein